MTETVENIILEHLRHIRARVDRIDEKIDVLTLRVGSVEQSVASLHVDVAVIHQRLDHQEKRLERIDGGLSCAKRRPEHPWPVGRAGIPRPTDAGLP